MDGANERFMNNGAVWLANHLMVYNVRNPAGGNANNPWGQGLGTVNTTLPIQSFDLRKIGDIINQGNAAKAYELCGLGDNVVTAAGTFARTTGSNTNSIDAYFLPWDGGQTFCGQLGNNARYFFTPTLNGCTFAYDGAGPNVKVAHSNIIDNATLITDQVAIDAAILVKFGGGAPAHTLIKTQYKPAIYAHGATDYRAMVVGIRTGNNWAFYYQNYHISGAAGDIRTGVGLCVPV